MFRFHACAAGATPGKKENAGYGAPRGACGIGSGDEGADSLGAPNVRSTFGGRGRLTPILGYADTSASVRVAGLGPERL
jgi:hypothetical protein